MTNTTIKRDRKAETVATMTLGNVRRFGAEKVGGAKVWDALHRIGVRDGLETLAILNRCGLPEGGIGKAEAKGRKAIEEAIGRSLTGDEAEAYGFGFNAAAYSN